MTVFQVLVALLLLAVLVYGLMYVGWLPRPRGSASSVGTFAGTGSPENPETSVAHYAGEGDAAGRDNTARSDAGYGDAGQGDAGHGDAGHGDGGHGDAGHGDGGHGDAGHGDRERSQALTLAWVDGTYLSTSVAVSRHERVGAAGMNVRAKANMVVDDSHVRWEREGLGEVRVAGSRLLAVSTRRSLADMLMGHAEMVLVSWRAGNSSPADRNVARADDNEPHHRGEQKGSAEATGDLYVTAFLPRSRMDSAALVSAVQRLMKMDGTH